MQNEDNYDILLYLMAKISFVLLKSSVLRLRDTESAKFVDASIGSAVEEGLLLVVESSTSMVLHFSQLMFVSQMEKICV